MVTSIKPAAKPADAKSVVTVWAKSSKAGASAQGDPAAAHAATSEPSLRFYHSKALRGKTQSVLAALEASPDHPKQGDAMADLVAELIEAGMDYYFLKALKQAQIGFVGEQSARLGISGAVKLLSSVSRKFIVRMDQTQLLSVAHHIHRLA